MKGSLSDQQFERVRACFYHETNHEVEVGWTERIDAGTVVISSMLKAPMEPNERVLISIFGSTCEARFIGRFLKSETTAKTGDEIQATLITFRVKSEVSFLTSRRRGRKRADGVVLEASIGEGERFSVPVIEASYTGISIFSPKELAPKLCLTLHLTTRFGGADVPIEVQNCAKIGGDSGKLFRVGARVSVSDRIAECLWRKFSEDPIFACDSREEAA